MLLHVMQQSEAATFGQVLKYWRTLAGLSLRDVEATTEMSATNLSRIERGLIGPPPNLVLDKLPRPSAWSGPCSTAQQADSRQTTRRGSGASSRRSWPTRT